MIGQEYSIQKNEWVTSKMWRHDEIIDKLFIEFLFSKVLKCKNVWLSYIQQSKLDISANLYLSCSMDYSW